MIGQRRAKLEYGLSDDDLASLMPCSQCDGGLYDEADLARVRDANPACRERLAAAKRQQEDRNLAIREGLRHEREEAEKNEREFWQPLRNGRTPEQLYNDPLPEELVAACREHLANLCNRTDKREVARELLDQYLFGGVMDPDKWDDAKNSYFILGIEEQLIATLLGEPIAI